MPRIGFYSFFFREWRTITNTTEADTKYTNWNHNSLNAEASTLTEPCIVQDAFKLFLIFKTMLRARGFPWVIYKSFFLFLKPRLKGIQGISTPGILFFLILYKQPEMFWAFPVVSYRNYSYVRPCMADVTAVKELFVESWLRLCANAPQEGNRNGILAKLN